LSYPPLYFREIDIFVLQKRPSNSSKAGIKDATGELPKAIIRSLPETGYFCQNLSQANKLRQTLLSDHF
jgi:hypothetical protein